MKDEYSFDYKPGFKRTPTWAMAGGVKSWVNNMPENILANQFPLTPRIFVDNALVESFFKQRLNREEEITGFFGNEDLDRVFPQKFDQCQPSFGYPCQFKKLCFGHVEDPLKEGFVWREPHHESERVQLGLSDDGSEEIKEEA
jgi:hypothetical protein